MGGLRVMISSTVEDLVAEREAVDRAIATFQFERFRSESMGSLNRPAEQVCEEMARECELYILIIGEKYGWEIPSDGISVTEREFNVARETDPEKILVYVKKLPVGVRENRADMFLKKATDFSMGYFRAAPFSLPIELEQRVKNDMAIWITDRIRKGQLSASNVFALPLAPDILKQAMNVIYIMILSLLAIHIARIIPGVPKYAFPSVYQIVDALIQHWNEAISAAINTLSTSIAAYFVAIFFSITVLAVALILPPRRIQTFMNVIITVGILLSVFFFFLGRMMFGPGKITALTNAAVPAGTMLLMSAAKELRALRDISSNLLPIKRRSIINNLVLSYEVGGAFLLTFGLVVISDVLYGYRVGGLGRMIIDSQFFFQMELSYMVIFLTVMAAAGAYFSIRFLQSYFGWSYIIGPLLLSKAGERYKL